MDTADLEDDCVLVLAPAGRDGPAVRDLLQRAGLAAQVRADVDALLAERMTPASSWWRRLGAWIEAQPRLVGFPLARETQGL